MDLEKKEHFWVEKSMVAKCAENPILFVIDRAIKPIIRN